MTENYPHPIFRHYLEEEGDKPYYTMNSLAFYYEDMARKQNLIEDLAKAIAGYDITMTEALSSIEKRVADYVNAWDGQVDLLPETVNDLLTDWVKDGTVDTIIEDARLELKADKAEVSELAGKLAETQQQIGDISIGGILTYPTIVDLQNAHPNGLNTPVWITLDRSFYFWDGSVQQILTLFKTITSATTYGASGSGGWKGNRFNFSTQKNVTAVEVNPDGSPTLWELWDIQSGKTGQKVAQGTFEGSTPNERGYLRSVILPTLIPVGLYVLMIKYNSSGAKNAATLDGSTVLGSISGLSASGYFLATTTNPTTGLAVDNNGYVYDTKIEFAEQGV